MDFQRPPGLLDFVGGIDNEALDFSQLEAYINSDACTGAGGYFSQQNDSLIKKHDSTSGLLSGLVPLHQLQTSPGQTNLEPIGTSTQHRLPESPPDSGSEHPYSPPPQGTIMAVHYPQPPTAQYQILDDALIYTQVGYKGYKDLFSVSVKITTLTLPAEGVVYADLQTTQQQQQQQQAQQQQATQQLTTAPNKKRKLTNSPSGVKLEPVPSPAPLTALCCSGNEANDAAAFSATANALLVAANTGDMSLDGHSQDRYSMDSSLSLPVSVPEGPTQASPNSANSANASQQTFQCIRFSPFRKTSWHVLCDQSLRELPTPHYRVDADKGFNFSQADEAFVCQKKNHFQITCHAQLQGDAQFVKTADGFKKIRAFHLHFYGVKVESPTHTIKVEQSQSDRSKRPFHPVFLSLSAGETSKATVARLHFAETTANNMRKKGRPNPDQRYFRLVVALHAHTTSGNGTGAGGSECAGDQDGYPVVAHASERIIVRASNPGQFESDVELCWQRGQVPDSIFHAGKVGINMDKPDETLVVHGNIKVSGHVVQPSDARAKENIQELDTRQQLENVKQLRVVSYSYHPEFVNYSGIMVENDTGVIAQEVQQVIPEAVAQAGNIVLPNGHVIDKFLVVNKDRLYMENIGAVKELCKMTENLEARISELEKINQKFNTLRRCSSCRSKHDNVKKHKKYLRTKSKNGKFLSSQLIQIIIVVLIFILASCLAAMSTIYFFEHSNRHNRAHQHVVSTNFLSSPDEDKSV
ncbi:myelin regulatory factor-like [Ctenocephalides felis]|uniref:myelin regulatory factor-like n=1 Tax=Ctenocephalides felis TaxID=7515 RepID=UPI000E6E22B8|nr:myelin regulatory factor-like [Ctenocephalides felis]